MLTREREREREVGFPPGLSPLLLRGLGGLLEELVPSLWSSSDAPSVDSTTEVETSWSGVLSACSWRSIYANVMLSFEDLLPQCIDLQ